jgi:hypothetical protein
MALQYNDGTTSSEVAAVSASTSAASQWEELEFRFGDLSDTTVNAFVILFDPGSFTSGTYFFDNLTVVSGQELVDIEELLEGGALSVYPNPSQGLTQFKYELKNSGEVSVDIFDLTGRKVASLPQGFQASGAHELSWDASSVQNGLYVYQFSVNQQILSGKIVISRN